jgi:hypothetical protein
MATKIQVRRDTLSNWTANNPVLSSGEIGFVTDNNRIKIGNGSSAFTALSYLEADAYIDSVILGTDTTGDYVTQVSASGAGISVTGSGESASVVISNTGVTSLSGTESQISVSSSAGTPTISLPNAVVFPGTVTLNADPTQPLHAATKQYVDALAEGLTVHASVQAATTASVNLSSPSASVDGVALTDGMRVLVKNQTDDAENGIYVYNSSSAALVRASDYDTANEIAAGDFVFVSGGTTYESTSWVQVNNVTTLGTDPIIWEQFAGVGTSTAGPGIDIDGTQISNTGVLSLAGTANKVSVSASTGNVTLTLPDDVALTGVPTAPTASVDTNSTQVATTTYVVGQGYLKSSTASATYQPLDADLTSIAGLAGTSGLLRKTAADTYTLDTTPSYPVGGESDRMFYANDQSITANYTIESNKNAGSFGPITIDDGVAVTIPSGSSWQII